MFNKIEIPSSWKEEYTKYPNGKTIWEALSAAMSSFNDFVDEVNTNVQEGLLSIDQAEDTLRGELNASFSDLEEAYEVSFTALQDEVDAAVASVEDKVSQAQLDAVNAQLAEIENRSLKLTNLRENGNFKDGALGWSSYSVDNLLWSENNTSFLPTSKYGGIRFNILAALNDKLYFAAKIVTLDNLIWRHWATGATQPIQGNGTEQIYSGIYISPLTGNIDMLLGSNLSTGFKSVTVKWVKVINLTTIFGAGNEPTKSEMDTLINLLGWFDGEITVTEKQLAIWTLNLIRQNRNAIISLGGTII